MTLLNVKRRLDANARGRRRVVTVIGSGKSADPCCAEVGRLIATLGFDLLTGAGRGVMEAVSRAFYETSPREGVVIGIVPAEVHGIERLERRAPGDVVYEPPPGYPNEWVELAIYTHLPDSGTEGTLRSSRNHINVLTADAIVALPGGEGTESEAWLALQYGVSIVAYGDYRDGLPHGIARARSLADVRQFLSGMWHPESKP
jgi:predicted Rossmann-fold nucleotide-binding protein